MKDMGEITEFLNMKVEYSRTDRTIRFSQGKYTADLLTEFLENKSGKRSFPMEMNWDKQKAVDDKTDLLPSDNQYRNVTGKLIYLANLTRPDISYAVSKLCGKNNAPTQRDWKGVQHLLEYINQTKDYRLTTGGRVNEPICYSDASFKRCLETGRSTTGFVILYGVGAVIWKTAKQKLVARSTCHAEYYALHAATQRIEWIRNLFKEIYSPLQRSSLIYEDNEATIKVSKNVINTHGTFDIDPQFHRIRESVDEKSITIEYIPTADNIADIFTKPVTKHSLGVLRPKMGVTHGSLGSSRDVTNGRESWTA